MSKLIFNRKTCDIIASPSIPPIALVRVNSNKTPAITSIKPVVIMYVGDNPITDQNKISLSCIPNGVNNKLGPGFGNWIINTLSNP